MSQIPTHLSGGAWLLWAQFSKALRCAGGSLSVPGPVRIPIWQTSRSIPARKGAATEVDAGAGKAAEAITKMTSGRGVDTAIEAVRVPATFVLFEDIVAPGGTIAKVGVHGVKADLHLERLWSQNITITTRLVDNRHTRSRQRGSRPTRTFCPEPLPITLTNSRSG